MTDQNKSLNELVREHQAKVLLAASFKEMRKQLSEHLCNNAFTAPVDMPAKKLSYWEELQNKYPMPADFFHLPGMRR